MTAFVICRRAVGCLMLLGVVFGPLAAAPAAEIAFADKTVVGVDATTLDVRIGDPASRDYPNVGYRAPVPYDQAIRTWAAQRFSLTGQSVNTLRITLREGTIVEKLLPVSTGISGWFKKEQSADYQGTLAIEVAIIDPNGKVLGSADAKSWSTQSVGKDATQSDRDAAWAYVVQSSFDNLDRELIPRVRQILAAYVH